MSIRVTGSQYIGRAANLPTYAAFTICVWTKIKVAPVSWGGLIGFGNNSVPQHMFIGYDSGANYVLGNSPTGNDSILNPPVVDEWRWVFIRGNGTGVGSLRAGHRRLSDTTLTLDTAGINQTNSGTPAELKIGTTVYDGTDYINAEFAYAKCWDRALSDAELLAESFSAKPVSFASLNFFWPLWDNDYSTDDWGPNSRGGTVGGTLGTAGDMPPVSWGASPILVPYAAAAGGTNLIISDAAHGHTAETLALTTASALAVQDAAHAHVADNLALTSAHAIIIQDATHAHAADSINLSQNAALSIADALHAHTADNLILTTASTLAVQDATHSQLADSFDLTSAHGLIIADALHGHAAENLTLDASGATALTIADATHGHSADNIDLTSTHTLTIGDATHAHVADSLTLSTDAWLAIQDAAHAHGAENLTLSAGNAITLVVSDASHGHAADNLELTSNLLLVIADALHAHIAENVVLDDGQIPSYLIRVRVVTARSNIPVVTARDSIKVTRR